MNLNRSFVKPHQVVKYYLADRKIDTVVATEAQHPKSAVARLEDEMITLPGTHFTRNGKNYIFLWTFMNLFYIFKSKRLWIKNVYELNVYESKQNVYECKRLWTKRLWIKTFMNKTFMNKTFMNQKRLWIFF